MEPADSIVNIPDLGVQSRERMIGIAALLHDVGKTSTPDEIPMKKGL